MATRGTSKNIIVGAAQLFVAPESLEYNSTSNDYEFASDPGVGLPAYVNQTPYADTLEADPDGAGWRNVGYTTNGLELQFQPDFGEVTVDQQLDVAKLYKQGMKVNLNTTFAEATLENLVVAIAASDSNFSDNESVPVSGGGTESHDILRLLAGELGECPVERALVAVGPSAAGCTPGDAEKSERIYVAYRVLSMDQVSVSAKRDEATSFQVSFRLLPADDGVYGKVVDRTYGAPGS